MKLTAVVTGILMTLIMNTAQCTLITKPKDAAAKIGDFVIMSCSSNHVNDTCGKIIWYHIKPNSTDGGDSINPNDKVGPLFTPHISIIDSMAGHCDLRINATPSAAGRYECFDGVTDTSGAVLIVLENVPVVKVVNQSSHSNVVTALECAVNYYGKLAPKVQWVKIAGNSWTNVTATESKITTNPVLSLIQFSSIIQISKDGATEHFMCDLTISTITWKSLECPAGRNQTTKVTEPYNNVLGHGIGIGFAIGVFLSCIIFLILWRFKIFQLKGGAKGNKRAKDSEPDL